MSPLSQPSFPRPALVPAIADEDIHSGRVGWVRYCIRTALDTMRAVNGLHKGSCRCDLCEAEDHLLNAILHLME